MTKIKERIDKWKGRKWHQKLGDILFWVFLALLIIPGPRKMIATSMNKVILHLKRPSMTSLENAYQLTGNEYNWKLVDETGNPVAPEDLRGEVIFLNFWGTYCPPCIAEMPEIQGIYNDYSGRVKFLLVTAEDPAKVRNFMQTRGYDMPVHFGGRNMPDALSVRSIPTTFIISPDGHIVSRKVGAADWDSKATRKVFDSLLANR